MIIITHKLLTLIESDFGSDRGSSRKQKIMARATRQKGQQLSINCQKAPEKSEKDSNQLIDVDRSSIHSGKPNQLSDPDISDNGKSNNKLIQTIETNFVGPVK